MRWAACLLCCLGNVVKATRLFTRNDVDEMGCLLALLLRQCCEGFTCLFTRHDLGARVLHQHPPMMHHAGQMLHGQETLFP